MLQIFQGEYWERDSSCEKSWVPVQSHWVPVQKKKKESKIEEWLGLYVTRQWIWKQTPKLFTSVYKQVQFVWTFFESLQQRVINSQMKKAKLSRVRQQGCIRELCTTCSKFCLLGKSHTGMVSDVVLSWNFQCNVAWQFVRIMLLAMQHLRKHYM